MTGLGFLHLDTPARDSLASDLMEPVRANVDGYLLNWILDQPLRREWFFEQRNGNCRLTAPYAIRLSETATMWARAVAPVAEWVARRLWTRKHTPARQIEPPTRLTQARRREAQGGGPIQPAFAAPRIQKLCRGCGKTLTRGRDHCTQCAVNPASERLIDVARIGRTVAHTSEARAKEGEKQRQHAEARNTWTASSKPEWLTAKLFDEQIRPRLCPVKFFYCVADRRFALVCGAHPEGLSSASTALAGVGRLRRHFRKRMRNGYRLAFCEVQQLDYSSGTTTRRLD